MIALVSVQAQSKFGFSVGGKGNVKTKKTLKEGKEKGWNMVHLDIWSHQQQQQIGKLTPALSLCAVFNGC